MAGDARVNLYVLLDFPRGPAVTAPWESGHVLMGEVLIDFNEGGDLASPDGKRRVGGSVAAP